MYTSKNFLGKDYNVKTVTYTGYTVVKGLKHLSSLSLIFGFFFK